LGGCSHLPQFLSWAKHGPTIKAAYTRADMGAVGPRAAAERLYADAVGAIDKRDYGQAIGLLQIAREAHPADPRVLTAMGVVYDKLGRFDLSDRYYDQAEKADPGSRIVAQDRQYSMFLRSAGKVGSPGVALAQAAPVPARSAPARSAPAVATRPAPKPATGDELYARAVQAIEKREYGVALGALREARDSMPGDARVLTALAVTYDHLGRFDLSSRYYDQADKIVPGSAMVAADRRNSLALQKHGGVAGPDDVIVLAKTALGAKAPPPARRVADTAAQGKDQG
jgi:Flp pilus assembly protein TadD